MLRVDDSCDHLMQWFEHGPDAPATKKSIGMINKYHAHFANSFPEGFANADDYIYILCMNATPVNSAVRSLGLPGFSEKQKGAAYLLCSKVADQFTMPDGRPVTSIEKFPDSFDAMVTYVDEYQARPGPCTNPAT